MHEKVEFMQIKEEICRVHFLQDKDRKKKQDLRNKGDECVCAR